MRLSNKIIPSANATVTSVELGHISECYGYIIWDILYTSILKTKFLAKSITCT